MPTIFIGLLALALVLWLAKSFVRVDPKYMIRVGRTAGGIVALAGAAFLGARGRWWHCQHDTASDRTPLARMLPSVIGGSA